jgi:hypothetical protein
LHPNPTFTQLVRAAEQLGTGIINVPVGEDMHIDRGAREHGQAGGNGVLGADQQKPLRVKP